MEYTKLKYINQYKSKSINPAKTPDTIFEMYSVPIYATGHPEYLRGDEIASNKAIVRKNDILLCKINPRINRVWVVSDESGKQNIASSEWIVIRNSEYNPEFLAWYFRTPKFQKFMTSEITGIGGSLTRAQPKCVAEYPVPVLNRKKQDEIVNILDKCKLVIDSRKRELLELDNIIKARFVELFGDPRSNPFGFEKKMLKDTCKVITGNTPSRAIAEYYGDYIEWIKTDNIVSGILNPTQATESLSEKGMNVGRTVEKDSSLMACIAGSIASIGRVCITDRTVAFNQQINAVVPEQYNILFLYVLLQMSKDYLVEDINMALKGILSKSKLEEKEFIIPPMDLQEQFSDFVKQVDKSKVKVQKALDETQKLFDSLMQQYFG